MKAAIPTKAIVAAVLNEVLVTRARDIVQPNHSSPRSKYLAPHYSFKGPLETKGATNHSSLCHGPVTTTDCPWYIVVVDLNPPIGGVD